ncbi:hypothetical protein RRF57_012805 [Xylaria bambusicola]|uniref:Uncharacterized protein n=1 Tax=Xylaria bambusicola TaxID=326684 RepID=A0AAN7V4L0_9PEZI
MRLFIWNRFEEHLKVTKESVEESRKCNGISRPVDISPIDQVYNTGVKHVEDRECGLLRGILESYVSYAIRDTATRKVNSARKMYQFAARVCFHQGMWKYVGYFQFINDCIF